MKPTGTIKENSQIKKIFYFSLVLPFILFSCEKTPDAHFFTNTVEPEVGQDVIFTNDSHKANRFEWDFGDGYSSTDAEPVHSYEISGQYEVTLTAYSKSGLADEAYITIDVLIPTMLVIEVVEWYDEYSVADASVYLYPSLTAWDNQTDLVAEGFTADNGQVVFSNLDSKKYYVDVWEEHHNNYTLRDEDSGFVETYYVAPHTVTYFIAWVDYVESAKDDGTRDRSLVIKKLERKSTDKSKSIPETDNWQELYNRSIKVK